MYLKNDDYFNSKLVKNSNFVGKFQIPQLIRQELSIPRELISFGKRNRTDNYNKTVHFYMPDKDFMCFFNKPYNYLDVLKKFDSVISTDASLYRDMPLALQLYNTYRNRQYAIYLQEQGIKVIPNVRWGSRESFDFCFDGIPRDYIVSVGTHGCINNYENKYYFQLGLNEMLNRLKPKVVIVYGRMPEKIFAPFIGRTIFINFESEISQAKGGK